MAQNYDLQNTGPEVQDRLDQTETNEQAIAELQAEIGESGHGGNTINGRLDTLETAVGSGGSVDERIAAAKESIIGGASSDYNTLGKIEGELEDTYRKNETYNKDQLDNMITTPNVQYVTVIATSGTTDVTTLLPATGSADTVYRVGNWDGTQYDTTVYALYAWNGSAYVCLAVRSSVDEVYDISTNHPDGQGNPTTYANLSDALGTNGANIPTGIRRGGMSVKFVSTSDNKYVQYRLRSNNFTTQVTEWEGIEDFVRGIGIFRGPAPDRNPLITDADDAEVNRIYAIGKANYVAHLPSDGQGVLQTLSYASNVADIRLQIFVSAVTEELYWRIKWGSSYGEWNGGKTKFFEDAIDSLQRNTIPCTNGTLLDQENWINNHYLNANNTQGESSDFAISNYIPCTNGQTIYFTNCGNNLVLFYDKNNNYISGYNRTTNNGYVIVPNSDSIAYLRFNVVKANIANGLFVSYNENDHIWNIPYGEKKYTINDIAGLDTKETEDVTIGTEYNTLKSALDYADTVANENHIVNILVPDGEYNVFSDIDLYSQDSSFKGLIVPDYVNIIGIGAAKDVILKAELPVDMTGYAFTRGNVSTLNLWRNNNLKNLTVIGSNMRYAIHNDTATGTAGYVEDAQEVFENCIFIGRQTDVAVNVDSSFGSGMRNGAYLKFKNCKFKIDSVATESTGVTFATNFHNTANSFKTITWDFENCLFSSGYKNFAMYVTNYSGVKNGVIILNGCKIDKRVCVTSQTGSRNSDYIYYGSGSVFTDTRRFYTNGVDLVDEDIEMLL